MADRFELIARKEEVRRKIERTRRDLARERHPRSGAPDQRKIEKLENQLEQLMAQEFNLRLAIDRSRPQA